jgi:hypothetical protein
MRRARPVDDAAAIAPVGARSAAEPGRVDDHAGAALGAVDAHDDARAYGRRSATTSTSGRPPARMGAAACSVAACVAGRTVGPAAMSFFMRVSL